MCLYGILAWSMLVERWTGGHQVQLRFKNRIFIFRMFYIANTSKFTEKCFFDWRNLFADREHIRKFFSKQEDACRHHDFRCEKHITKM